ncbi:hypothetical protein ASAP_2351 [Asaia bogorensis]|uniref:Uncharacterized protein n=1 Tax=Asaia bogorensis TaxID=91915 RepID=A0A060QL23_9PROT|nr:hypothetical protein ASAP_2351 [Asaia bogorensis]
MTQASAASETLKHPRLWDKTLRPDRKNNSGAEVSAFLSFP